MSLKLCYSNLVDASGTTITANSSETSLPVSNITNFWKTKVHRATGDAAEELKFDFGSAQNIWVVAIVGHNYSSGATVTLELNATDAWGAPSVSQVIAYNADMMIYVFTSAQNYRWARITIADGSNPDGYVEEGRVFLGGYLSPERNFIRTFRKDTIDPSLINISSDSAVSIDSKTPFLRFTLPFRNTLIDNVETVRKDRGRTGELFAVLDSDNELETDGLHDLSRYVRFAKTPVYKNSHLKRYDFTLIFEELVG